MRQTRSHSFKRQDRVSKLIHRELADLLLKKVKNPALRHVMITSVNVHEDWKTAVVKVCPSMIGEYAEPSEADVKTMMKALKSAAPYLFEQCKRSLPLKFMPWFEFEYDPGISGSSKVWGILSSLDDKGELA
jgi:ribosome-binding factor A